MTDSAEDGIIWLAEDGIYEGQLKVDLVERLETVIVLVDSDKVGLISFAQLGQVNRAITNGRLMKKSVTLLCGRERRW